MDENQAVNFINKLSSGKEYYTTITIEHSNGDTLEDVELHVVDKQMLVAVLNRLPDEMFDAVDGAEDAEQARENMEETSMSLNAVGPSVIEAFEELCKASIRHPELTNTQVHQLVDALSFEALFGIGSEIINISAERTGEISDFQKQV